MAAQLRQSQPGLLALVPSGTSIVHSHDAAPLNTLSLASSIDELIAALRPGGDSVGSSEDGSTRAGKLNMNAGRRSVKLCPKLQPGLHPNVAKQSTVVCVTQWHMQRYRGERQPHQVQHSWRVRIGLCISNLCNVGQEVCCLANTRQCKAACYAGDTEVPHRVVQRMKGLLMHAQTEQAKAEADHRIAAAEAAALNSRIG